MKYNIIHDKKMIVFWLPKSGTISLMRLMAFLKYGESIDPQQLRYARPSQVFRIFSLMKETDEPGQDYSTYKTVLFGRNPYCRILSGYIDKYVNRKSTTPTIGPENICYNDFIVLIRSTKMQPEAIAKVAEFSTFCPADQDDGHEFYQKIGAPHFSYVSLLRDFGFPEGALHHSLSSIQTILDLANQHYDFERASGLVLGKPRRRGEQINDIGIASWPSERLWTFIQEKGPRSISLGSFYTDDLLDKFEDAYSGEFAFYERLGLTFDRPRGLP